MSVLLWLETRNQPTNHSWVCFRASEDDCRSWELLFQFLIRPFSFTVFFFFIFFTLVGINYESATRFAPLVPPLYKYLRFSRHLATWSINQSSPNNSGSINKLRAARISISISAVTYFFLEKKKISDKEDKTLQFDPKWNIFNFKYPLNG